MPEAALKFHPVTKTRWKDFEALFESPGAPKYCWCMAFRVDPDGKHVETNAARKGEMANRVERGVPIGIVGYDAKEPVAWVSIAPRETYRGLGGPDAADGEVIWSLACMFLRRQWREQGVGHQLIAAAAAYAKKRGATVLEAYPVNPDSSSYRFMGFIPAFKRAGFKEVGTAGTRRHVMRLGL